MTLIDGRSRMQKEIIGLQKEGKQQQSYDLKMIYFIAFKQVLSELNQDLDEHKLDTLIDDYEYKYDDTLVDRYF
ncbi:MAG: hypothetical protein J7L15_01050 [Clostridiales bacterium]|nr:hypothetical protein [Clostridiales bacterium]